MRDSQHTEQFLNGLRPNCKLLINSELPPPIYITVIGSVTTSQYTAHAGIVRRVPFCFV